MSAINIYAIHYIYRYANIMKHLHTHTVYQIVTYVRSAILASNVAGDMIGRIRLAE